MHRNKKRLSTLAILLALVFTVSAAFAATSGTLEFRGTVNIGATLDVQIVEPSNTALMNFGPTDSTIRETTNWGTLVIDDAGQFATVTVGFAQANSPVTLSFAVENKGSVNAKFDGTAAVTNANGFITLGGTYANIMTADHGNGPSILNSTVKTSDYTITIDWNPVDAAAESGSTSYSFTIGLPYVIAA